MKAPTSSSLATLFLIRHGETEWSLSGQHAGRTDLPLTPRGEIMARELGERLRVIPFDLVLTSPLLRARRTCELAGFAASSTVEPDLAECNYGDFEGRTAHEIRATRPDWDIFRMGSPSGESPTELGARADRLIDRLRQLGGNIALFSHGHFGRVLGMRWVGLPVGEAQHLLLAPTSLSVLGYENDASDRPALLMWNALPFQAFSQPREPGLSEAQSMRVRAIQRWENEGGEIPQ